MLERCVVGGGDRGPVRPEPGIRVLLPVEAAEAADAVLGDVERAALLVGDGGIDRPHLVEEAPIDLAGIPEVPEDVDRPGIEQVGHVLRHVAEPVRLALAERARGADEVATHEADAVADAAVTQVAVEQPVALLVLGERETSRVRLVEERHPERADAAVADQVGKDVGEARHVRLGEGERAPLPGDVDLRARTAGKVDRSHERGHSIAVGPLTGVEEDPHELRLKAEHLRFEAGQARRRAADRRVHVLVELPAVAAEAADEHAVGEREVGRLRRRARLSSYGRRDERHRNQDGARDPRAAIRASRIGAARRVRPCSRHDG